jgi:hypothetical protein
MSVSHHEAMAGNEDKAAELHAAQYKPDASVQRCGGGTSGRYGDGGCRTRNPSAAHLGEAKKHREMAADHRAASQSLRDAEFSDDDRDMSPFMHRDDIASVKPLTEGTTSGKNQSVRTTGAIITFRAAPGMTAQWLQRVVDYHLARNAALGHEVPEMTYCPLVPKDVTARVTATEDRFAVAVRSDDSHTAAEVLRRARTLVGL